MPRLAVFACLVMATTLAAAAPYRIAIVKDALPGHDAALAQSLLDGLRRRGHIVEAIDGEKLCSAKAFEARNYSLLVLPTAGSVPAKGMATISTFMEGGGDVVALRGPAFREPLWRTEGQWISNRQWHDRLRKKPPAQVLLDFRPLDPEQIDRSTDRPETLCTRTIVDGPSGKALAVHIPEVRGWDTVRLPVAPFPAGHRLTCLLVRGSPGTRRLCAEWQEKDGSRWIASFPVTEEWRRVVLEPEAFRYWNSVPTRGKPGDALRPGNAVVFRIGVAMSHSGPQVGPCDYAIAELGTLPDTRPARSMTQDMPPVVEGLSPAWKFYELRDVDRLAAAAPWRAGPADLPVPATPRAHYPRPTGKGFNKERGWRWIPLAAALGPKGEWRGAPASVYLDFSGPTPGSVRACFAVEEPGWYREPPVRRLVLDTIDRMARGVYLEEAGTEFFTYREGQQARIGARVANLSGSKVAGLRLRFTITDPQTAKPYEQFEETITLEPGGSQTVQRTLPVPGGGDLFGVRTELFLGNKLIDRVEHELGVYRPKPKADRKYVTVRDGDFYRDGRKWYVHGVNYMPSSGLGIRDRRYFEKWMGTASYDPEFVQRDLERCRALGFNSVSIFIYHESLAAGNLLDCLRRCERLGLMVNLSIRPGTPMDYRWDWWKEIIERTRIPEFDIVYAYDIAWEPFFGTLNQRRRHDPEWRDWLAVKHGSLQAAESAWGVPAPRHEGKLSCPTPGHLGKDGKHRRMVADYRRFVDDLVHTRYQAAADRIRAIDPNHLVSFRMTLTGDPTYLGQEKMPYDFRGVARSMDFMAPEGYGRIGDWNRVKPGMFTVTYARACAPGKPVLWAEAGVSAWDRNERRTDPARLEFQARYYADFYRMVLESRSNGIVWWWYPGGYRVGENSDYGIVNPDGTDRPVTRVIREHANRMLAPRAIPKPDVQIRIDRDADARGIYGVYEKIKDDYWRAIENGKTPGLVEPAAPVVRRVREQKDWPGARYRVRGEMQAVPAGSWPAQRRDNARSGVTPERLPTPLHLQWTYVPRHKPCPAWPEPGKELHRMAFDYAFHVSIGHGLVFFGSSADHKIYALDLETGQERWSFFTEGPVRFAPALAGTRIFAASDDGCVYCLSATDGKLLWQHRVGPSDEKLIGNGQMVSRWPARAGVLVENNVVYAAAGMWSTDGVYVTALRAGDGEVIWRNDTSGELYMKFPHDVMEGIGGVSPQGALLLCRDTLVVPNGRAMPAGFDSKTGALRFCRNDASKLHHAGGTWNLAAGDVIFGERHPLHADRHVRPGEADPTPGDGLIAWTYDTGEQVLALHGKHRAVIHNGLLYATGDGTLTAMAIHDLVRKSGRHYASGKVDPDIPPNEIHPKWWWHGARLPWYPSKVMPVYTRPFRWETPVGRTYDVVLAGNTLVTGGRGRVAAFGTQRGKPVWQADVEGAARGLAVAAGRLVVSLDNGRILCFGPGNGPARTVQQRASNTGTTTQAAARARQSLDRSGVRAGYALLLGAGNGALAAELARQSDLTVCCIETDARGAAAARERLDRAAVYGPRVTVHHGTAKRLPYPDYCASLLLVESSAAADLPFKASDIYRVLRPYGGTALLPAGPKPRSVVNWLKAGGVTEAEITLADGFVKVVRRPLPDAGRWTHPYADAERSAASDDRHVRLPLRMLWYGGPGPGLMVSRHWRAPAPLSVNGRLFVAGENHLLALDAYTGRGLWTREWPGVGRFPAKYRGACIVADERHVYVALGARCLRLDCATGKTLATYELPPEAAATKIRPNPIDRDRLGRRVRPVDNTLQWEYLAVTDKLLLGSAGLPNVAMVWWPEAYPECRHLFALHKENGQPAWVFTAERSVLPNAVAVKDDHVYLIDSMSKASLLRIGTKDAGPLKKATLIALDLATGSEAWRRSIHPFQNTICAGERVLIVKALDAAPKQHMCSAHDARSGELLWEKPLQFSSPILMGNRLYIYPNAYDLRTGKEIEVEHPLSGKRATWRMEHKAGCGTLSGCPGGIFFRSGTLGMVDLARDTGTHWLGQLRSSCWLNVIAAGGLLLCPEGGSNCSCPHNYQTSFAMMPDDRASMWSVFPERGAREGDRIRRLALNFGAVGDRRDAGNRLWLAYPRPFRPGSLHVPLVTNGEVDTFRRKEGSTPIRADEHSWLYASGCTGPFKADLDLGLARPAPAPPCGKPPRIDGRLDDACWDGKAALRFTTDEQAADERITAFLRSDTKHLYIGFRRLASRTNGKLVPWTASTSGQDAPVWKDDSLNIRLKRNRGSKLPGLYLSLSASGATFDGLSKRHVGTDPKWNGAWQSAVHTTPERLGMEVALPWSTLKEARLSRQNVAIYLESANRTGVGPERTQHRYRPYTRLQCYSHPFIPVVYEVPAAAKERSFRVLLHFVELEELGANARVFDVKLQGRTVLEALDIAREAGGSRIGLVKTIKGVRARDKLTIELVPRSARPPVLCGLQLHEEKGAMP